MIGLEDEADFAAANRRERVFGEAGDFGAVEDNAAGGGRVETGEEAKERGLAAAGWTHDGARFAALNFEVDTFEDVDAVGAGLGDLSDAVGQDQPPLWLAPEKIQNVEKCRIVSDSILWTCSADPWSVSLEGEL